jgi:hypothetical protein
MTPQEFKAWFEGYTEAIEEAPSQKQWKRIKTRVAEIDGVVTTHTVFRDRYYQSYPMYAPVYPSYSLPVICQQGAISVAGTGGVLMNTSVVADANPIFSAFSQLGVMDAQADLTTT